MKPSLRTLAALAALALSVVPACGGEPPKGPGRLDTEWIIRFEQTYGPEGLYLMEPEVESPSPDLRGRLDLLELTHAAEQYLENHPQDTPTTESLLAAKLVSGPRVAPGGGRFVWNASKRRFECTAVGSCDLVFGALLQIQRDGLARHRMATPSRLVRDRWKALVAGKGCPELIKREVELREYLLQPVRDKRADATRKCQAQLDQLAASTELYAASRHLKRGDTISIQEVGRSGLLATLERCPDNGDYAVTKVGAPPTCSKAGDHLWNRPDLVRAAYHDVITSRTLGQDNYPPALVLRARYAELPLGLQLINRAIEIWPDVPSLRVERLAFLAQKGDLAAFTPDLDYILERFPSAVTLYEIEVATRKGGLESDLQFRKELASVLSHVRPELFAPEMFALSTAAMAGDEAATRQVWQRILSYQPGYADILPGPGDLLKSLAPPAKGS